VNQLTGAYVCTTNNQSINQSFILLLYSVAQLQLS